VITRIQARSGRRLPSPTLHDGHSLWCGWCLRQIDRSQKHHPTPRWSGPHLDGYSQYFQLLWNEWLIPTCECCHTGPGWCFQRASDEAAFRLLDLAKGPERPLRESADQAWRVGAMNWAVWILDVLIGRSGKTEARSTSYRERQMGAAAGARWVTPLPRTDGVEQSAWYWIQRANYETNRGNFLRADYSLFRGRSMVGTDDQREAQASYDRRQVSRTFDPRHLRIAINSAEAVAYDDSGLRSIRNLSFWPMVREGKLEEGLSTLEDVRAGILLNQQLWQMYDNSMYTACGRIIRLVREGGRHTRARLSPIAGALLEAQYIQVMLGLQGLRIPDVRLRDLARETEAEVLPQEYLRWLVVSSPRALDEDHMHELRDMRLADINRRVRSILAGDCLSPSGGALLMSSSPPPPGSAPSSSAAPRPRR